MRTADRLLVYLARRSWRVYRVVDREVELAQDGRMGVKIPIFHGLGLTHVANQYTWMATVVRKIHGGRPGVFVDAGANIGQTLLAVQSIRPDFPYLALEPDLEACYYLDRLIKANGWKNVSVVPLALGSKSGFVELHHNSAGDVSASLVTSFRPPDFFTMHTKVLVEPGDDLLDRLEAGPVAVLKIDVEGGELEVIEGMRRRLSSDRPAIIMEVLGYGPILSHRVFPEIDDGERSRLVSFRRERIHSLDACLKALDYRLARIGSGGELVPVHSLDSGPEEREIECNFVAQPRELETP